MAEQQRAANLGIEGIPINAPVLESNETGESMRVSTDQPSGTLFNRDLTIKELAKRY
jgi:hypothetical protein